MTRKLTMAAVLTLTSLSICSHAPGQQPATNDAQQPATGTAEDIQLTLQVTDIKHSEGQLLICVFDREEGFPRDMKKALKTVEVKPSQPTYQFNDLPPGNYAIVVIHDRNESGQLDTNLVGMPKEPVGVSNFQTIGVSNRPTFRKALFAFKASGLLKVKLNSF